MTNENLKETGKINLGPVKRTNPISKNDEPKKKEEPKPTTSPDGAGEIVKPIGGGEKNPKKM